MINYTFTYTDLEYFLLILVRITSFIYIAPFFSINNTPGRVKIGLSFFLSVLVFEVMGERTPLLYDSVFGYVIIVMKEVLTGFLIGFAANLCNSIISFAGHVIDMEIGLSMVTLMDPTTRENTSISGVFYQHIIMLMLIVTGMYQYLLQALIDTFTLIPINGAVFNLESMVNTMVRFLSEYIIIGFRICLPVFAVMMLLNAILGILAKVSPQLNMFAVGIQFKVLIGLGVLFFTAAMLPGAANFIFTQMKKMVVSFIEGMM